MTAPPREPVAWMYVCNKETICDHRRWLGYDEPLIGWTETPLYAAPAPSADAAQPCCGEWFTCDKPCSPRADRWKLAWRMAIDEAQPLDLSPPAAQPAEPPATDDLVRDLNNWVRTFAYDAPLRRCIERGADTIVAMRATVERQAREIARLQAQVATRYDRRTVADERERDGFRRDVAKAIERAERAERDLATSQQKHKEDAAQIVDLLHERDVWKDKAETRGREGCEARAERDAANEIINAKNVAHLKLIDERDALLDVVIACEERIREWCNYCGGNRATCDNAPGECPARAARAKVGNL